MAHSPALAAELGLGDWLQTGPALQLLAGNAWPDGPHPLASAYSGHRFGQWAGQWGDGRAVLRSSIRELPCAEAMHALGIPTTRALAVVGSPALVRRETVATAAVLTRTAASFIRFGHFEHFAHSTQNPAAAR